MDLIEIPFDVPVILQSIRKRKSLQNPLGSKKARCLTDNRDIYEQVVLQCVFDPKEPGEWELFTMETDASCALYFVSCHTGNVLHCNDNNDARCANQNRQDWEAWRIVEPRTSATTNQMQRALDQRYDLAGKDRQNLVLELARCGKTPAEIEQIVTSLFDAPLATASAPTLVVQVNKE
ncbi:hypothetical protein GQ600_1608 [Phytophthora cactorum]|nr:hypothetical protein GQ600_1608 [Phytophthora cactorum]